MNGTSKANESDSDDSDEDQWDEENLPDSLARKAPKHLTKTGKKKSEARIAREERIASSSASGRKKKVSKRKKMA